jgi:hypothetical protein
MLNCQYCNRELKNQGAKNLHERKCEKNPNRVIEKEKPKVHKCKFRFLNPKNKDEAYAISLGYTKICVECSEIE